MTIVKEVFEDARGLQLADPTYRWTEESSCGSKSTTLTYRDGRDLYLSPLIRCKCDRHPDGPWISCYGRVR